MSEIPEQTTLVCLFHNNDNARAAVRDLLEAGVPQSAISVMGGATARNEGGDATNRIFFAELKVPDTDMRMLTTGLNDGGTVVGVAAGESWTDKIEAVFRKHAASQVDEKVVAPTAAILPGTGAAVVPVIEENLIVGKREVERGGVRVFRHIVETPVAHTVDLREEHVVVEHRTVNRPATEADYKTQGTIELTGMAEVPVVGKMAHVVEEVLVGKQTTERTERVRDTLRKTEVEVERLGTDRSSDPRSM
ncbi:hypothetical protein ACPOL_6969 (plasmid) [Acidisarcina polymorpha]|uniref:DUF2382 domain-containing protein n=1 Tax=Acidisarcina polymorpha TaxID=2211140 RepID=A0A2Z5GAE3_9BACT|nr:YsnF/AvaK domain-containing protein [Acidisarcina polymorpha]AXC16173.1 hypothetical protein ACPOL_6969 [Acidisarcina polymorpha]